MSRMTLFLTIESLLSMEDEAIEFMFLNCLYSVNSFKNLTCILIFVVFFLVL